MEVYLDIVPIVSFGHKPNYMTYVVICGICESY